MTRTISAALGLALATVALAGPLTPPAGPVASTNKALAEVEPRIAINTSNTPGDATNLFIISQPGSYYLTQNIDGVVGKHGISINASNVSIDLNGFAVRGTPGMGAFNGIRTGGAGLTCINICNGTISGWGGSGITLSATAALVSKISAALNLSWGIIVGNNSYVEDCVASTNTSGGISANDGSAVTRCTAASNTGTGIAADASGLITQCVSYGNQSGFSIGSGGMISLCTARINSSDGIRAFTGGSILSNTCKQNGSAGAGSGILVTSTENRIEGNNCAGNQIGITVSSAGNIIVRNSCASSAVVDWNIAANNVFGPIVDRRAPASAAVNGFAAASSLGSTDPNANFSY